MSAVGGIVGYGTSESRGLLSVCAGVWGSVEDGGGEDTDAGQTRPQCSDTSCAAVQVDAFLSVRTSASLSALVLSEMHRGGATGGSDRLEHGVVQLPQRPELYADLASHSSYSHHLQPLFQSSDCRLLARDSRAIVPLS